MRTKCPRCRAEWSGMLTGHCAACHETFEDIHAFDVHRQRGKCAPPASIAALVLLPRAYRCWGRVE
ncbi:hypothetical protein PBI_JACE_41 [Gordonia phage Jace]|uniref:Phage FDXHR zinc binding domain-containing protein n=1 Tax=Gordonia phage Jace TaxID=2182360 RepID=A0A2U8UJD2_9CAUD|nr:hypothetical protein HOT28_gp41 [Gordonia phage Jace]AWN03661.1 hypothetical protein PBI_JACE_41 [Gordonia phage Jace]